MNYFQNPAVNSKILDYRLTAKQEILRSSYLVIQHAAQLGKITEKYVNRFPLKTELGNMIEKVNAM